MLAHRHVAGSNASILLIRLARISRPRILKRSASMPFSASACRVAVDSYAVGSAR